MTKRTPEDPRFTPIILRRELIASGYTDRTIRALVEQGTLAKVRRGAYADATAWASVDASGRHELMVRAVLRQSKTGLVPSHASGVPFHEGPLYGLDLSSVDVTRIDGRSGRAEAGVRQHRGKLVEGDLVSKYGVQVISPTRNALEVTTQTSIPAALCVVNDYLHRRLTTPEQLQERYHLGIEHWNNSLHTEVVLRLAHPDIESVAETLTWHLMWTQHIPRPVPQFVLRDGAGAIVARLDFAWPELGVYLEVDGKTKYTKYVRDGETAVDVILREKQREAWVQETTGWVVIRVVWSDLFRPEQTAARIRRILDQARAA